MKKRFAILFLCLSMSVVATGCGRISAKRAFDTFSYYYKLAFEGEAEKPSDESEEASYEASVQEDEADTSDDVEISLKNVYVTGYTSDNGLFACDSDEFYQNLLLTTVDVELLSEENGNTLESLSKAWNAKIDTTVEALKNSPNLTDDDKESLDTFMSQWSDFDPRYQKYWLKMFGPNGKVPGSMYTEIMVDNARYQYEIFAGALMALEYEVSGENVLNLKIISEDQDLSEVNLTYFEDYDVCIEADEDFKQAIEQWKILDMSELECRRLATDIASVAYTCSGDDADGSPYVVNFVLLNRKLTSLESGICSDSQGVISREDKRTKLLALEMMNIQYMMNNDAEIQSEDYIDEEKTCYHVAVQRKEEVDGEYRHVFDYFFVDGHYLGVTYPSKSTALDFDRHVFDACDFEAEYVDVTFDGNKDIVISLGHQGNVGTMVHCAFVYDDGIFEYVKSFESIPNYSINESEQCIEGWIGHETMQYVYEDGEFVEK